MHADRALWLAYASVGRSRRHRPAWPSCGAHAAVKLACPGADATNVSIDDAGHTRCPSCGARITVGAPWCTLCYADLRPAPEPIHEPIREPVSVPASVPAAASAAVTGGPQSQSGAGGLDPLTAPLHLLDPAEPPPTAGADVRPVVGWPCLRCGESVPLDGATCPACGSPFLAGAVEPENALERIVAGGASKQTKFIIMVGGSLGLLVLILGLMYLFGSVL